jgi:dolichol-phosphate mannosyltransferase
MEPVITVVVPVYNEESLIDDLAGSLLETLNGITPDFEIIAVNDGSTDSTLGRLIEWRTKDQRIKILDLSRNFGHQAAFSAGLAYSKGKYTVMMDGDLQDPPSVIKDFYTKISAGKADIVYGKRLSRKESFSRKLLIGLFHTIFKKLSRTKGPSDVGNFCMMNRTALQAFLSLHEKNRYLPGLRYFIGFRQEYVEYNRESREKGKPKMTIFRLISLAFDAIFSFSKLPIKISLILGILGILASLTGIGIVAYKKLIGEAITGWTSTMLSIYFLGSVQLLFLGILGEYIYRIYKETQNRPVYIVKDYYQ